MLKPLSRYGKTSVWLGALFSAAIGSYYFFKIRQQVYNEYYDTMITERRIERQRMEEDVLRRQQLQSQVNHKT